MASEKQRALRLRNSIYAGRTWVLQEPWKVAELFEELRGHAVRRQDRASISWYKGKAVSHLRCDYSRSALLSQLGLHAVGQSVVVTACTDLVLMVELCVHASDGSIFSKNECRAVKLGSFPSPEEIAARCAEIRKSKPKSDYMDRWTGFDGSTVREIPIRELFHC
jgi:hypothetical protein